jgi:ferredoxin/truncated hemoglobin YjbI
MSLTLRYGDRAVTPLPGETVLNALLRAGIDVPFSCKAGACHTCLSRCTEGDIPERAQRGLAPHLLEKRYFLPCKCKAVTDMTLTAAQAPDLLAPAEVLAPEVLEAPPAAPLSGELPYPAPDPELWAELQDGQTARRVLEDFYDRVYADALLSPFFERVTKDRVTDKQYSFMRQCVTGEKVYFGQRPRNAHHWMIISEALFDHRQALMLQALQACGLTPGQVKRWVRIEEHFRPDMVKSEVWPRRVGDEDILTEGFASETLTDATVCDHCGAEIAAGTTVAYHRRLGQVSCRVCASGMAHASGAAPHDVGRVA